MDLSALILYAILIGLGTLVGYNLRNASAEKREQRTIESVDEDIRNQLSVAQNLNHSLLEDVKLLRKKVASMSAKPTDGDRA